MTQLRHIKIDGLRGVRGDLALQLDGKSALVYGDNGSGKSCLSDVLEWFYNDRVDHLSNEEIGRLGLEALRNVFLKDAQPGAIEIAFTKTSLDCTKTISVRKNGLTMANTNSSPEFQEYIRVSQGERLLLRYRDLARFVVGSKMDRLKELSNIIGYGEVTAVRDVLRKTVNSLKNEIKVRNFEQGINQQQAKLVLNLGQNITSTAQLLASMNDLIRVPLPGRQICTKEEINDVLDLLKTPGDTEAVDKQRFYGRTSDFAVEFERWLDQVDVQYAEHVKKFEGIVKDIDKISKLIMENLLSAGLDVLNSGVFLDDQCPLCLQPKNRVDLSVDIQRRLAELDQIKREKAELTDSAKRLREKIVAKIQSARELLKEKHFVTDDNKEMKGEMEKSVPALDLYIRELDIQPSGEAKLKESAELRPNREFLRSIKDFSEKKAEELKREKKDDSKFDAYSKITLSRDAYSEIEKLKVEKEKLEKQQRSMEIAYAEFLRQQKEAVNAFLSYFSTSTDELYQFMNMGEKVECLKLFPVEKNDELAGVGIECRFLDGQTTPPHKYLSESHLNCVGLAFFLTSVKAFNKQNKFFILDDVISSFDSLHRKRFADLLLERFSDYQIIVLTHEKYWFDYLRALVKGKNWVITTMKWSEKRGTFIEDAEDLREKIESKIKTGDLDGLANDLRTYLEQALKLICLHLGVKVDFRFNDENESRLSPELLSALRSSINKHGSNQIKNAAVLARLSGSLFIGNVGSHDNPFAPNMADCKAFWADIKELEALFVCNACGRHVSMRHYDEVNKKIRCGCGSPATKEWEWKK